MQQLFFLVSINSMGIVLDCALTGWLTIILEVMLMLINEIAKRCNITKKAVQYYVEQELLFPEILENGYRDFKESDVEKLKSIVLYRKLDLSISEIKQVLNHPELINGILHQRTLKLEKEKMKQELLRRIASGERIENLQGEIQNLSTNAIISQKLLEMFPSYYGKYISLNFARYLTCEIETEEQMKAFEIIIEFFDNAPDLELPDDLKEYLDEYMEFYSSEQGVEQINQILEAKDKAFEDIDEFTEKNKEILDEYYRVKQTEEFKQTPAYRFMEIMKEFCSSSGYYDVFIPAMRRLSPLYNEYYEQMLRANEEFVKKYPEYVIEEG